jgi:hypothetical protein
MEMRKPRTTAIAGALVVFELLAPKAMAEEPLHITNLDLSKCKVRNPGGWPICPLEVPPPSTTAAVYVVVPEEVLEVFKEAQLPTKEDIAKIKKSLEATPAPESTK